MRRYTVPEGVTGLSVQGREFTVQDGKIEVGDDVPSDAVNALLRAACVPDTVDDQEAEKPGEGADPRSVKQKIVDKLKAGGVDANARMSIDALRKEEANMLAGRIKVV